MFAFCAAILLSASALYSACDDTVMANSCTTSCQDTDTVCIQACTDDTCKSKCATDLDNCKTTCTSITVTPADGGH
jgi:hypothetical protein